MQKESKLILQKELAQQIIKRLPNGIAPSKVANEYGISTSIMSLTVRGLKNISFSTLWQISEAINVTPDEIVKGVRENLPNNFSTLDI